MIRTEFTPSSIAGHLSPQAWVDGLCRELLAAAVPPLVSLLAASRPRCLFLGGSASLGEALGWSFDPSAPPAGDLAGPGRILLSDLDVGVLTDRPVAAGDRRRISDRLEGLAAPILARFGAVYRSSAGRPCPLVLGLYETRALATQRPTLGLVDAAHRGLVLWGDPAGPARFSVPALEAIPAFEAWRLVGNRSVERLVAEYGLDPAPAGGGIERTRTARRIHARAKMAAGLWTAQLVLQGRYQVGWGARARLLEEAGLVLPDDPLIRCAARFRSFLEDGSAAGLPTDPDQRRLLAAALRQWLIGSSGGEPPASAGAGEGRIPELGFLAERLTTRERFRLWKLEEVRHGRRPRAAAVWRSLRRALDPSIGVPEARRFALAALFWRLFGETGIPGGDAPGDRLDAGGEAASRWKEATRLMLGEPWAAGPDLARQLLERLGLGASPGSPAD